jgi:hypothetical protein
VSWWKKMALRIYKIEKKTANNNDK